VKPIIDLTNRLFSLIYRMWFPRGANLLETCHAVWDLHLSDAYSLAGDAKASKESS
jgi:hypothetical protein